MNNNLSDKLILSTKCSLKFSNKNKMFLLENFISDYTDTVNQYIKKLWNPELKSIPKHFKKEQYPAIENTYNLTDRVLCLSIQQASSIVRGGLLSLHDKENSLKYRLSKNDNSIDNQRKITELKEIISKKKIVPILDTKKCNLDSKILSIHQDKNNSFDIWIELHALYKTKRGFKLHIPIKQHQHYNRLQSKGNLLGGVIITSKYIQFNFDVLSSYKDSGSVVGIDIGENFLYISSDNQQEHKTLRPYNYKDIVSKLEHKSKARKFILKRINSDSIFFKKSKPNKYGLDYIKISDSKNQLKLIELRKNYINEQLHRLRLDDIKTIRREDIYSFSNWEYSFILDNLDKYCYLQNVSVNKVDTRYTSQRCNVCGWTYCLNRNGEKFKCRSCQHVAHADKNACLNIAMTNLLSVKDRKDLDSSIGFFWNPIDESKIKHPRVALSNEIV